MDQAALVKSDRDVGAQVMEALSRVNMPVTLCEWNYVPQIEDWQLVIATPWHATKGPLNTYRALIDALKKAGIYERVPIRRVSIKSTADPLVKALQREAKEHKQGFLHLLKHRGHIGTAEYSLIFAPISRPGGAIPARRFSNVDELRHFLAEDFKLRPQSVEDALDDMMRSGAGSIYPVSPTTRQLRKLSLN